MSGFSQQQAATPQCTCDGTRSLRFCPDHGRKMRGPYQSVACPECGLPEHHVGCSRRGASFTRQVDTCDWCGGERPACKCFELDNDCDGEGC